VTVQNVEGRKEAGVDGQVQLGLLPLSHIYGLVPVAHYGKYLNPHLGARATYKK